LLREIVKERALLVLTSVYLYNEHQGFTQLELMRRSFEEKFPHEQEMVTAIAKHAADEKKHYFMFRKFFEMAGLKPLRIGKNYGYIDRLVFAVLRSPISRLDHQQLLCSKEGLSLLFRLIILTESRGLRQVKLLLKQPLISNHEVLGKLFQVIADDEPSHFLPYKNWLAKCGHIQQPRFNEKLADLFVHMSLVFLKIPLLFFNLRHPVMRQFPL